MKPLRVAGLMSGTSADGVDVAIVDIAPGLGSSPRIGTRNSGTGVQTLAFDTVPYSPAIRRRIIDLFDVRTARVDEICRMNYVIGGLFADALIELCRKSGIGLDSIDLIGSHGQTIHHLPSGIVSTLQIGEPCVIAQRTGITTVADFRARDVAAGGQGAPLVPLADCILFSHPTFIRATQNIGGIANVTFLPATKKGHSLPFDGVLAFDTGPGNMIIDRLAWRATGGGLSMDNNGLLAAKGKVNRPLLRRLMRHPYLRLMPPKTTGREEFGIAFADELYRREQKAGLAAADIIATATAFTAASIADAYRRFLPAMPQEVILCGGGVRNPAIVAMLAQELSDARVLSMDELGVNADAKEAISFAILAYPTIHGLPGNIPAATGAAQAVVLGKIVPGSERTGSRWGCLCPLHKEV